MSRPPVAPPGWPSPVRPPDSPDWERSAMTWLYDLCPPDVRGHEVLRRHPVALAHLAAAAATGAAGALEQAMRTARAELTDELPPEVVESVLAAYERERLRAVTNVTAVQLVGQALRGQRWAARL